MVTLFDPEPSSPKPLNGAQFSQGTLFKPPKPTEEHRWPRGYSPERKAAVESSLDVGRTEVRHYRTGISGEDVYLPSSKFFTPSAEDPHKGVWARKPHEIHQAQREQAVRAQTDIIARSTIPLEHLEKMPAMHVGDAENAAGYFAPPRTTNTRWGSGQEQPDPETWRRGRIMMNPTSGTRAWQERSLIHEIGHHVDLHQDPTKFIGRAEGDREHTPGGSASPSLEGYAEGYAHGHYRPRRGSKEEGIHPSSLAAYQNFHNRRRFIGRFAEASGGVTPEEAYSKPHHMGPQFEPEGHQLNLFSRDAPSEETSAPGYKDVGQHPLVKYWEKGAPGVGTIKVGRG